MVQPQWKFRIPQESEVNQNPIEGEFFTTNDVGGDSLVRESIQNSLDATLANTDDENFILRVRYYFSGKSNSNNVNLDNHSLFKGIFPHMLSADNGLRNEELPKADDKTEYLVIEDFNTTGLDGSVTENDDPQKDSPLGHNFYWFWRNVGRSGKRGSERGKWGLGKTVFPASSSINTFFALTKRYDDQEKYLMGLSVLKTHHLADEPNTKRYPYGYFGNYENTDKFFVTPTNDKAIIDDFERLFNLKRVEDASSGLSVVIPFPQEEISSKSIIRSVLRQYFHPIINKKLTVEVVDQDNAIDIQITDKTIFTLLKEIEFPSEYEVSPEQLSKLFDLCAWSINQSESEMIRLNPPPLTNSIMWRRDWFVTKEVDEILKMKSNDFDEGKKVSFLIPVKLQKINSEPQICWFKLFLEKDEQLNEADSHFVRNGITITGVKKPKNKFVRALVVIEDEALVTLLGDAENPAHTEWQKDSSHFRGKYEDGDKVISFVEKSIDNICSLLSKPTEGIDRDIMKDPLFRPVYAATGPDGCLYIVDMYRGIIQEGNWVREGSYLRGVVKEKGYDKFVGRGRIYKIIHEDMVPGPKPELLNKNSAELLQYLGHPNGWWRNTAQKLIILKKDKSVVRDLVEIVEGNENWFSRMLPSSKDFGLERLHALWTLEGLDAIEKPLLKTALKDKDPRVRVGAIRICEHYLKKNDREIFEELKSLAHDPEIEVLQQLILSLRINNDASKSTVKSILDSHPNNEVIKITAAENLYPSFSVIQELREKYRLRGGATQMINGYKIFNDYCSTCHGADGKGIRQLAPTLVGSPRVTGDYEVPVKILLNGLSGPVDGVEYNGPMAAVANENDQYIADVLSYIRTHLNNSESIWDGRVRGIREKTKDRNTYWTLKELEAEQRRKAR